MTVKTPITLRMPVNENIWENVIINVFILENVGTGYIDLTEKN
jgi:hypothetical protein